MDLPALETEALKLSVAERARLAEVLLRSLDDVSDEDNERLWLDEAERRDGDFESGRVVGIPGDEVFARIRARLR